MRDGTPDAALQAVEADLVARREAELVDARMTLAESILVALRNDARSAIEAMRRAIDADCGSWARSTSLRILRSIPIRVS